MIDSSSRHEYEDPTGPITPIVDLPLIWKEMAAVNISHSQPPKVQFAFYLSRFRSFFFCYISVNLEEKKKTQHWTAASNIASISALMELMCLSGAINTELMLLEPLQPKHVCGGPALNCLQCVLFQVLPFLHPMTARRDPSLPHDPECRRKRV